MEPVARRPPQAGAIGMEQAGMEEERVMDHCAGLARCWMSARGAGRGVGVSFDVDHDLALKAADGDAAACEAFVRRRAGPLFTVAERMLGDAAEAEDVVQETVHKAWAKARAWRPGDAKYATWMHRVAMNACLDRLRKRARLAAKPPEEDRPDETAGPAELLERRERVEAVRAAVARLPERQRAAITLCGLQELTNIEAAEILGVSVEALESLLARARRTLRKTLTEAL